MTIFRAEPYNDDYSEDKKFYKILFRPGYAVQARELNQIQTMIQTQVERHGNHIFKQGAMVVPGQISLEVDAAYVKLQNTNLDGLFINTFVDQLVGRNIVGADSGVVAEVIFVSKLEGSDPTTIYVRYKTSGLNQEKVFIPGENLVVEDQEVNPDLNLEVLVVDDPAAVGIGSLASVQRGIYYVNGYFVLVEEQTIVLDKFSNTPSYRVGLKVNESIITPEQDETLLDNAQTSPNYAAPGAHRYYISLDLEKRTPDSTDDADFIELLRSSNGEIKKQVRTTEYSILEQTLARRTFDESGNYTVRPFEIDIREHRNNDRGAWEAGTDYIIGDVVTNSGNVYVAKNSATSGPTAPVHTTGDVTDGAVIWAFETAPFYNRGVYQDGDIDSLAIGLEPGKAYVQGFEIEKISTEFVTVPKSREFASVNEAIVPATMGNYVIVNTVLGIPNVSSFEVVNLRNTSNVTIGTARARGLELHNGSEYKLFLFNVTMNAGQAFSSINNINNANFSCNVVGTFALLEPEFSSLVFPLPYYAIKSIDGPETNYTVMQRFTAVSNASGEILLSVSNGTFASAADNRNYIVSRDSDKAIIVPNSITPSGSNLTVNVGIANANTAFTIIAAVRKVGVEKTKTLISTTLDITTEVNATATIIPLGKADGYRVKSVKMKSGTFVAPGTTYDIDITDRYVFDGGQKDEFYDVAKLNLRGSFAPPTSHIRIEFEYFNHSSGDYFTLNSYSGIAYGTIPPNLRDAFDFRPRINDLGNGFTGTGSSITLMPKRAVDITTDFEYYLARKTKVALSFDGNFFSVDGVSSLNPGEPLNPDLGMVLYNLSLEPYTFGTDSSSVQVERIDNRRYTMRDIGKLESRIDNLEYYTSLSLLEQETQSLSVIDGSGNDRFKNGFIVDGFTGHNVGDVNSQDYLCSIDMEKGILRPFFSMENVNLVENANNASQRVSKNYQLSGDVITLPIQEHVTLVEQQYASRTENVNPFAIFTFLGDVKLNPSSDDWFEVERRPDIVKNSEGNYNTIVALAEKSGVLGTIWNSWQTSWTGAPTPSNTINVGGRRVAVGGRNVSNAEVRPNSTFNVTEVGGRNIRLQTVANQVGQNRTGVRTSIVTKVDRQVLEDRVLSTAVIPFIRSRNILVQARGLKPNTVFYPFFDDINVSAYCTPATWIQYTGGDFDSTSNAGSSSTDVARRIGSDTQVCLNIGDVVRTTNNSGTAVVVGSHTSSSGLKYLHVVNVKGTFSAGQGILGSISGATGNVSVAPAVQPSLKSNNNGDLNLLFFIPNTEALRFRTGTRELKLVDVPIVSNDFTSRGVAQYRATGLLETKQATVNAVRNAEIVRETVVDQRVVVQSGQRISATSTWHDPLAQTFLVQQKGGAFLTKVDIFFASKDENVPVTLEIREVVNGYPGKRVLPFSRVTLKPGRVNISSKVVRTEFGDTPTFDTPTTFNFQSPVYVEDNQEYCVVLLSDSNKYKVWISQIGDTVPGTTRTISEQPYAGVLFKSQNASTWTANQYQDLKFKIYRAKFATNTTASVEFVNDVLSSKVLEKDPFQVKDGNARIRVFHKSHGLRVGSSVVISDVSSDVAGIPASTINGTHTVLGQIQLDSFLIDVGTAANASGYFGGSGVKCSRNVRYDSVQPIVQIQSFPETSSSFAVRAVDAASGVLDSVETPVLANENNDFMKPRVVEFGETRTATFKCYLSTTNDSVSPVIDTQRISLVMVTNMVDHPTSDNTDFGGFDNVVTDPFFVPDTKNGSTTYSKYVTRQINLNNPSNFIRVRLSATVPVGSDIELYYKTLPVGSTVDLLEKDYVLAPSDKSIVKVEIGNETLYEISYSIDNLADFNALQIKIALKSTNTSAVPKIKDLRVIACA